MSIKWIKTERWSDSDGEAQNSVATEQANDHFCIVPEEEEEGIGDWNEFYVFRPEKQKGLISQSKIF